MNVAKAKPKRVGGYALAGTLLFGLLVVACQAAEPVETQRPEPEQPRLAGGPVSAQEQASAAELLSGARAARAADRLELARERADSVVARYPATASAVPALRLAAEVALEQGDLEGAIERARRYGALFDERSAEAGHARRLIARAEEAAQTREAESDAVVRVGVILPLSGSEYLEQYGELILQGVRLAEEEHWQDDGRDVELLVRDDVGNTERSVLMLEELEREGAVAVIGPLLDPAVLAVARARRDTALVIVSPTATLPDPPPPNVYSLNMGDTEGAAALAQFALRAGLDSVAVMYPRLPEYSRQASEFIQRIVLGGGTLVSTMPYDSGRTSFGRQLQRVAPELPRGLYVPAPERDVRQIAPQIAYYGLDSLGIQVLGGRAWASRDVRRLVAPRYLDGVIASTPMFEDGEDVGWSAFVDRYESTYRRTLDNRFPALGYDALRLALAALPSGRPAPRDVARRFANLYRVGGATGVLSVRDGGVVRRAFLVRLRGDSLVTAPPPELYVPPPRPDSLIVDSLFVDSLP